MRVGFLSNQLDNRGTGNAMFDYAHYNEEILGNESVIYTFPYGAHSPDSYGRYLERFKVVNHWWNSEVHDIDVLYHIKSGFNDGFIAPEGVRYAVHSVFDNAPHGDRYAFVSDWLADKHGGVAVPHIIDLPSYSDNFRRSLEIPEDAVVFGRHGGFDTFDIPFVWDAINEASLVNDNLWFLFLNTCPPNFELKSKKILFLNDTANQVYKRIFINTCDAMIHARSRGETFGISVGEFAKYGKPVISYTESYEQAHYIELERGDGFIPYRNRHDVLMALLTFEKKEMYAYTQFTPEYVMDRFKRVFLDENS